MPTKLARRLNLLLLLPLIAAGMYLSIRADQRQTSAQAKSGGPSAPWKPVMGKAATEIQTLHDLKPVPNVNPNAPEQPRREQPIRVVATLDGKKAYVTLHGSELEPGREVAVVDLEQGKLLKKIRVGSRPKGLALHPGGRFLIVLNWFSNYASVIDTQKDEVVFQFYLPYYCQQMEFNRAGTVAYVSNFWKNQVLLVDMKADGDKFEAKLREVGGFNRIEFLGYHKLATSDRRFAELVEDKSSHEGQNLARCSKCDWADWYPAGQSFQCRYCGVLQDFKGRLIQPELLGALSKEKVSQAAKKSRRALTSSCGRGAVSQVVTYNPTADSSPARTSRRTTALLLLTACPATAQARTCCA